jgi:3-hydroxybutyryl-CoA dehydrogenase
MDLIGLDTAYEILDTMYKQGRDRLHAPTPVLKQMITAGMRGRKTGRGFYTYEAEDSPVVVPDALTPEAGGAPGPVREIRTVGVVGSGTMATGIVEVLATAGYASCPSPAAPSGPRAGRLAGVEQSMEKRSARQARRPITMRRADHRIVVMDDLAETDLVVEAVVEADGQTGPVLVMDEICAPVRSSRRRRPHCR